MTKPKFFPMSAPKPSEVDQYRTMTNEALLDEYYTSGTSNLNPDDDTHERLQAELLRRLSAPTEEAQIVPTRFGSLIGVLGSVKESGTDPTSWQNIRHVAKATQDYADLFFAWDDNHEKGNYYFGTLGSHPEREFQVVENGEGK